MKRRRPQSRGFTIIELLVVIAIIVVLLGIVLAVGTAVASGGDATRTRNTLEILDNTLAEWEALTNRQLTWGVDGQLPGGANSQRAVYDMQEGTYHVFLITDALERIATSTDMKDMLAQISQDDLVTYVAGSSPAWIRNPGANEPDPNAFSWEGDLVNWVGGQTVLDAWDHPFRIIHPGRKWRNGDPLPGPDVDGTVHTPLEDIYGVAVNGRPYFVSAGADGEFGSLQLDVVPNLRIAVLLNAQKDNMYSYEVLTQ